MLTQDELETYLEELGLSEEGPLPPSQNKEVFDEVASQLLQQHSPKSTATEKVAQKRSLKKKSMQRLLPYIIFAFGIVLGFFLSFLIKPTHIQPINPEIPKEHIIELLNPPKQILR